MTSSESTVDTFQAVPATAEALRAHHGVRALTREEEGFPITRLPAGIYGFTGAPALPDTPIFARRFFQSFEVHKLTDGSDHLVGFVTPEDAALLRERKPGVQIRLYPEAWESATQLVSVPSDEIAPARRGPSREQGNFLRLTFA